MNNKVILIALISISLFFASCATVQTTTTTSFKSRYGTAKHFDIYGNGIMYKPVVADLEVRPTKVTASVEDKNVSEARLKKSALFKAMEQANADLIVEPIYIIEKNDRDIKVTVKGYPAVYKNFRTIQKDDIELLKAGSLQALEADEGGQSETNTTTTTTTAKKGLFGLGFWGL